MPEYDPDVNPNVTVLSDLNKEEQEQILSLIFRAPVKIDGEKFYIFGDKKNER